LYKYEDTPTDLFEWIWVVFYKGGIAVLLNTLLWMRLASRFDNILDRRLGEDNEEN